MDPRYSQPDSIPPLPSNAHSHSHNSCQQTQRMMKGQSQEYQEVPVQQYSPQPVPHKRPPYPMEDTLGVGLQQHASQKHASQQYASQQRLQPQTSNSQLAAAAGSAAQKAPHLRPLPFLRQARSRTFGHGRSDSAGSTSSFRSSVLVDAKPAPKRHYIWENSVPKTQQLTINQFEAIKRAAQQRPHEPIVQLEYAKKLLEASQQLAGRYSDPHTPSTILSDKKTEQKNREYWTATALKITKKIVSRANMPDAVFFLAQNYSSGGMGIDVDNVKAFELYSKAARLDHPEACYRVAVCYELGVGTKIDTERAFSWYKKAAPLNDIKSMYKLGMTYLNGGLGQQRNFREAIMWLQRAAEKADPDTPHAVHQLGLIFENARDATSEVQRDYTRAYDYFSKASSLGYSPAQVRLGRAFEFGELDRSVDSSKAMEWYTVAAQAGDSDAELGLSGFHWTGIDGVLRASDTEAFLWAERAAQKSNPRAEFALGVFYQLGVGVPADLDKARQMFTRAHEKRHPHALQRLRECERV